LNAADFFNNKNALKHHLTVEQLFERARFSPVVNRLCISFSFSNIVRKKIQACKHPPELDSSRKVSRLRMVVAHQKNQYQRTKRGIELEQQCRHLGSRHRSQVDCGVDPDLARACSCIGNLLLNSTLLAKSLVFEFQIAHFLLRVLELDVSHLALQPKLSTIFLRTKYLVLSTTV
jgi:hypothetical protein